MKSDQRPDVKSRQYSVCHKRACEVLETRYLSNTLLTCQDVLYVLEALPQPKNTRRVGVIPAGQDFVFSQAAGLTTQHGARPCLSNLCLECPQVIRLLSQFVLDYDNTFQFTTVTINYNYAAAKHRDVNHENGFARIIALGSFTGGGLNVESVGDDICIKNTWFDFDGTLLHATNPFCGDRYSLVYFTHIAYRSDGASLFLLKLKSLGMPCPNLHSTPTHIQSTSTNDNIECMVESLSMTDIPYNAIANKTNEAQNPSSLSDNYCNFIIQPNTTHCPQYQSFVKAESTSLLLLYASSAKIVLNHSNPADLHINHKLNEIDHTNEKLFPVMYRVSNSQISEHQIIKIAHRTESFLFWKQLCCSSELEQINKELKLSKYKKMPRNFTLDIFSYGRKLSTRQRRRIVLSASLGISEKSYGYHYFKLGLFLDYDENRCDECGVQGLLRRVHLCVLVDEYWNGLLSPVYLMNDASVAATNNTDLATQGEDNNEDDNTSTDLDINSNIYKNHISITTTTTSTPINATPLRNALCKILCNLALIDTGSFVCDCFCGSGSLLKVAKLYDAAVCVGYDVMELNSNSNCMNSNKNIYFVPYIDYCQANIYHETLHTDFQFDAIVCDPPYGRREKHTDKYGCDSIIHANSIERAKDRFTVLQPLMSFANRHLKIGGRLVFLFANYMPPTAIISTLTSYESLNLDEEIAENHNTKNTSWTESDLPLTEYPSLKVINICREVWTYKTGHTMMRDTVVIEKTKI